MGVVRIVGGRLKGRRLRVPDLPGVRPTPDRVRESVFNILGQSFDGERVLDAFAGSGALGLEALSRGAGSVVAVETNRLVADALATAATALGVAGSVRVVVTEAVAWAAATGPWGPFDLVFADPPYAAGLGTAFLDALVRGDRLAPGARVALERASNTPPASPPSGLEWVRTVEYGRTAVDFFTAAPERAESPA